MYHNIAPDIFRKRLIIEGRYNSKITSLDFLYNFLLEFTEQIKDADNIIKGLRGPFVFDYAYNAKVHKDSSYDGFIIWNENEVSTYIWNNTNFFTVDIYTCSDFDTNKVIDFVSKKFECTEFTWHELPQLGPFPENEDVEIKKLSGPMGFGLFAKKFIPKETFITYIDGEVVYGEKESDVAKTHKTAGDYVVPFHKNFYRNAFNSKAVTINHSCDPNCYVKDLFCMYAMRDIQKGEQLTQSYSLICNSDWKVPGGKCHCGSKNCHGTILPWRDLSKEEKIKYLPYTSDWILFEEMKKQGFVEKLRDLL
ncbi:MAG: SET domain-containing protein-lysine N-methyltransferase [Candidatus Pacebacteria bacterium]|nr:SET domain-containing protein-lysine N-methyltransferase [Candidatus Paceibacterota bacterium]MDD5356964.1 SET domain-containing protein-lysine N-methyltransferase [Candidatus Paceibacterota bacterium]